MSIYLQNLNPAITSSMQPGGFSFRKESQVIDMICKKSKRGFIMEFSLEGKDKTIIPAFSGADIQKKLGSVVNDLFRLNGNTLKGMI